MATEVKLMEKAGAILENKGRDALDLARQTILKEHIEHVPLQDALRFFIKGWSDVVHPALVSLACEAVGGKPADTVRFGASLVLLAGGADIHDDIIDGSMTKGLEETVFGKYGKDIAILAGDALLLEGFYMLNDACEKIKPNQKNAIMDLVKAAFFEVSSAEAAEAAMRGRVDISKAQFLEIIRHKVAAGEAAARIGALIGGGELGEVEILADYGRVYGVLLSIRDEFVDVFERDELSGRVEKEVLPLPIIVTLADKSRKASLTRILKGKITEEKIEEIVDIVTNSSESKLLVSEMTGLIDQINHRLKNLRYCRENLELLATATLEDL